MYDRCCYINRAFTEQQNGRTVSLSTCKQDIRIAFMIYVMNICVDAMTPDK